MKPERLDKALAGQSTWSRREVRDWIRQGLVTVDGIPVKSPEQKLDWEQHRVAVAGKELSLRPRLYLMMNKPAGVVSAIGFLGAGVIFFRKDNVRGVTTAAGLWATAGIGLAIGSGFYSIGIFSTVLMLALQILMHKFLVHADSLVSGQLQFTVRAGETFVEDFRAFIRERGIQATDSKITYHEDGFVSYEMFVRLPRTIPLGELDAFLKTCGDVRCVGYTAMP